MAEQPDSVELDPSRVEARVDLILHDNEPVPVLIVADGTTCVELAAVDPVAATRAALRIAVAANDLAGRLGRTPPTAMPGP